jgi:hypothetical protein
MSDGPEAEALVNAFERTCQKLCRRLARIVTVSGSQVLLARALRLAQGEFSFLNDVWAGDSVETCLEGLRPSEADIEPSTIRLGLTLVLANLIELLATFIGEDLTGRLVREVWPDAPNGGGTGGAQEVRT